MILLSAPPPTALPSIRDADRLLEESGLDGGRVGHGWRPGFIRGVWSVARATGHPTSSSSWASAWAWEARRRWPGPGAGTQQACAGCPIHDEGVLGPRIGRPPLQRDAEVCRRVLEEERVVADERHDLLVAVDTVLPEHRAGVHMQRAQLLENVLDRVLAGCHPKSLQDRARLVDNALRTGTRDYASTFANVERRASPTRSSCPQRRGDRKSGVARRRCRAADPIEQGARNPLERFGRERLK